MSTLYLKGVEQAFLGEIDMESDTIKMVYMSTSYTPDSANDQFYSDIVADIAAGSPTETLASIDVRIDTGNNRVEVDAADVSETGITTTTNKVIIYKDTTVEATSPLIACLDIGSTLTPVGGTLSLVFNAEGLFAINPA
jgi:hypothetical protein